VKTPKSHQPELVDCSDPTYMRARTEFLKSHQRELVNGSDPTYTRPLPWVGFLSWSRCIAVQIQQVQIGNRQSKIENSYVWHKRHCIFE